MLPRFHWTDISTVGHYLGVFIAMTGALMLVPILVALLFGEMKSCVAFVFGAGCCLLVGSLLCFLKPGVIDRRRSLLLTGLSWIVIGVFAAIPLYFTGDFDSPVDALFDSVSSLTTTGATLARNVDYLGYAHVVWRAILTLIGGQAVIFIAMYLGFTGEGGAQVLNKRHTSVGDRASALSLSWKFIAICASFFVLVGTIIAFSIGLSLGLKPVDAVIGGFSLAANAINTGGFVPHSSNIIYYHSLALEAFLAVYTIIGSINFGIFGCAMRGNWRALLKNSELRTFAVWLAALTAFMTIALTRGGLFTSLEGLLSNGVFMALSTATTGGFQSVYPQQIGGTLADSAIILLAVAAIFGTCSQSTGGGIKIIRIMQVLRWIGYSIMRKLMPDSARIRIRYEHFGLKQFQSRDAMKAMTVFILYLVFAAAGAMLFIAHGNDALQSVFESVSFVSNCGATAGLTSPDMSLDLKVATILLMWLGRLEFIALFAVIAGILMSLAPGNFFGQRHRDRELEKKKHGNRGGTAWRRRRQQEKRFRSAQARPLRSGAARVGSALLVLGLVGSLAGAPSAVAAQLGRQGDSAAVGTGGAVQAQDIEGLSENSFYRNMSISGMLQATPRLEGQGVRFKGEALGTAITADAGHKWVNLERDGAMIGVYVTNEQAAQIEHWGKYGVKGDTVSIKGTLHIVCDQHAGELEVHGDTLEVTKAGRVLGDAGCSEHLGVAGIVMAALGGIILVVQRLVLGKRRPRRPVFA